MVSLAVSIIPKLIMATAGILGTVGAVKTLAGGGLKRPRKARKAKRKPKRKVRRGRRRGR